MKRITKRISSYFNERTQCWSRAKKKIVWTCFVLVSVSVCGYAMIRPFFRSCDALSSFSKTILISPFKHRQDECSDRILMGKINHYKHFLDSLAIYDTIKYKVILKQNPHIIENVQSIQSFFSQLIKR